MFEEKQKVFSISKDFTTFLKLQNLKSLISENVVFLFFTFHQILSPHSQKFSALSF